METKLPHLKVGQIWRRKLQYLNITYTCFYQLKRKNSDNMWNIERLWVNPTPPFDFDCVDQLYKGFWHKDIICSRLELVGNEADLKAIQVLFG